MLAEAVRQIRRVLRAGREGDAAMLETAAHKVKPHTRTKATWYAKPSRLWGLRCRAVSGRETSGSETGPALHGQAVKTVAYLRVSTPQQDSCASQRLAILEYARKHDFCIDDFIEATASEQASEKRRRLDELDERPRPRVPTPFV